MAGCCNSSCGLDAKNASQKSTLRIALAINLVMFIVIVIAALIGHSSSLLSDSLDNMGDAITYALSLYAVSRSTSLKAKIAVFKGGLIFLAACAVLVQVIYKLVSPVMPSSEIMGIFSFLGLVANLVCLFLLSRHRHDDVNMSSVWACSRNDIASNLSVFIGAWLVWLTSSGWPDIIIALCLIIFLVQSSIKVMLSGLKELKSQK